MTAVVLDINLCLDGFVAAPDNPLGEGAERLAAWATGLHAVRAPKPAPTAGAVIAGRRTYDTSPPEWGRGGPHLTEVLKAGLVDEVLLHHVPVLLGGGRPFFQALPQHARLRLLESVPAPGVTQHHYEVAR